MSWAKVLVFRYCQYADRRKKREETYPAIKYLYRLNSSLVQEFKFATFDEKGRKRERESACVKECLLYQNIWESCSGRKQREWLSNVVFSVHLI